MTALTTEQKVQIRRQVGNAPDDAALQVIYDRLGDVDAVSLEVLEIRLAEFKRNPMAFSVPGEYSESRSAEQMKALEAQISALASALGETVPGLSQVRVVPPPDPACR